VILLLDRITVAAAFSGFRFRLRLILKSCVSPSAAGKFSLLFSEVLFIDKSSFSNKTDNSVYHTSSILSSLVGILASCHFSLASILRGAVHICDPLRISSFTSPQGILCSTCHVWAVLRERLWGALWAGPFILRSDSSLLPLIVPPS
jgi:hypothetical protein